jgi:hypothetical protein
MLDHNKSNGAVSKAVISSLDNLCSIAGCKRGPGFTCADVRDSGGAYGAFTHFFKDQLEKRVTASVMAENECLVLTKNQFEQQPVFSGQDWRFPGND